MCASVTSQGMSGQVFSNWAGSHTCRPELYFEPETMEDIQQILTAAREKGKKVKVVGKGHSFNDLACTPGYMISLCRYNQVLKVDEVTKQVTVQAGCEVSTLIHQFLPTHGLTLGVLGVVSDVTVSGWISTGTHGTGAQYGTSSSLVVSLDLMTASGEIMHISKEENQELMPAAVLSLGALGVILTVTLQCEPAFNLHENRHPAKLKDVLDSLEDRVTSSDRFHLEVFPYTDGVVCVHASRTTEEPTPAPQGWLSTFLATVLGFPGIMFVLWVSTFFPSLIPVVSRFFYRHAFSPARERVDSGQRVQSLEGLPSHHVTEWAIDRKDLGRALTELQSWITKSGFRAHFPIICRFVKSEDIFLSLAYGRHTCYVQLLMFRPFNKEVPHDQYWEAFQRIMSSLGGRPHWGKEHGCGGQDLEKVYPKWGEFCSVRQRLDPNGMFLNDHLRRVLNIR